MCDDPLADLRNLGQVNSLQQYLNEFDELYPRARIRKDQALSFFFFIWTRGCIANVGADVWPKTLLEAYALAKLQKIIMVAIKEHPKSTARTPYIPPVSKASSYMQSFSNYLSKP